MRGNKAPFDAWTPVHLGVGAVFGAMGANFPITMLLAVGYEIAEQAIERTDAGQQFFKTVGPESAKNVAVDLAVFTLGYALAKEARDRLE